MKYSYIYTFLTLVFVPYSIYQFAESPSSLIIAILTILFIFLATDIISGILHIVLDNERSLEVPILDGLARGFQSHHNNPKDIYQMSLFNHLYVMHLPLTFIFFIVLGINQPIIYLAYASLAASLHVMQMSHRWAHTPKKLLNPTIVFFQKIGFLLAPKTHGLHHNNVFDSNFCIMNGWSNFLLNRLVKIFGRTSHGWGVVFFIVLIGMLTIPLTFQ